MVQLKELCLSTTYSYQCGFGVANKIVKKNKDPTPIQTIESDLIVSNDPIDNKMEPQKYSVHKFLKTHNPTKER